MHTPIRPIQSLTLLFLFLAVFFSLAFQNQSEAEEMGFFKDQTNLFSALILSAIGFGELMIGTGAALVIIGSVVLLLHVIKNRKNAAPEFGKSEAKLSVPKTSTPVSPSLVPSTPVRVPERTSSERQSELPAKSGVLAAQEQKTVQSAAPAMPPRVEEKPILKSVITEAKMENKTAVPQEPKQASPAPAMASQNLDVPSMNRVPDATPRISAQTPAVSSNQQKPSISVYEQPMNRSATSSPADFQKRVAEYPEKLENKKTEIDLRLLTYIVNTRAAGFKDEEIVQALKEVGWSDAIINNAMKNK